MTRPQRVLLLGVDAATPGRWRPLAASGLLPIGQRLLANGCFARALPAMPTLTTTNWATIATGAWPSTHGVADFNPHRPGGLPDDGPQGFDARAVRAEFVWEVVARAGLRAAAVNWPGAWPPRATTPDGVVLVGGAGIELNEWRIGVLGRDRRVALAAEQCFASRPEPGAHLVALPPADSPFVLAFSFDAAFDPVRPGPALACRLATRGGRPVARFWLPGADEALAELAAGEWSERLILPFALEDGGTVAGAFRLKLLALDPAAGLFRLYVTDIGRLTWLERPVGVVGDPTRFAGLPAPGVGWASYSAGAIGLDTLVELAGMATSWLADTCAQVVANESCDLFCAHFHAVDSFYHLCLGGLSERLTPDPDERRRFEEAELAVYREVDAAIGRVVEAAGGDALTVLVSDHGVVPPGTPVPIARILLDAGLLATRDGASADADVAAGQAEGHDGANPGHIDWTRTLAAPQGSCFVRLNLVGRDPCGVVDPGDAREVLERVRKALGDYRDPATDLSPFTLVAPWRETEGLGLGGAAAGDLVYAVRPEFSEVHGSMLPDCTVPQGGWGMPALCLVCGPGAASGSSLDRPISLTDVAPTVCHALGVPAPAQADGAVRAEFLAR